MQKLPLRLYNTAQIRALEQCVIMDGIAGFELMTRAGAAAYEVLRQRWPQAQAFAVFCGVGNNAGDGYIIARLLLAAGFAVRVYAVAEVSALKSDALLAYQTYASVQGQVQAYVAAESIVADVIVDALLGTGLSRCVTGLYADAIQAINDSGKPVLAVDVPSGINADTGALMGKAVRADVTVTFIGFKKGLFTGDAPEYCGNLSMAELGVPATYYARVTNVVTRIAHKPLFKRHCCAHKGSNGHVLIIGGACGFSGAILLAGQAALRVGSGLVSLATRPEHAGFINLTVPELMSHAVQTAEQLPELLAKASVVVIGPGLGQTDWSVGLLNKALGISKPLIIDADALNLLAKSNIMFGHHPNWILTPHPGEAARLLNISTLDVQQDRFAAVTALQAHFGGIVVLKGAGSLIADAQGITLSNTGNPGMASGGMGDVLTGVIAGLCAQGLNLAEAVQQGVYIHGAAADNATHVAGERGLVASDLMPYLRQWVN
ncbi:MAG: NAD(P)H-hydrate dehydratase [Methylococcaceae bacterium]|nr:NAD(P)H-hydrate dehydratase [Methylococcaceae bacterium]